MNTTWRQRGFALPTVVISSLVLMMVLGAALSAALSTQVSVDDQMYQQLAREAAQAGVTHAQTCISMYGVVKWTTAAQLHPNSHCDGSVDAVPPNTYVAVQSGKYNTSYSVDGPVQSYGATVVVATGTVNLLRTSDSSVWKTYTATLKLAIANRNSITPRTSADGKYWCFGGGNLVAFNRELYLGPNIGTCPVGAGGSGEGNTTALDLNGNIIFAVRNSQVYDKNGSPAVDSGGAPLTLNKGAGSPAQAFISFPLDSGRNRWAVVSNTGAYETAGAGYGSLYITLVQMDYPGRVGLPTIMSTKNQQFQYPSVGNQYASEALAVMPNADATGYFVYTYFTVGASSSSSASPTNVLKLVAFYVGNAGDVNGPYTSSLDLPQPSACNGVNPIRGSISFNESYSKMLLSVGTMGCSNLGGTIYINNPNRTTGYVVNQNRWQAAAPGGLDIFSTVFTINESHVYASEIDYGSSALYRYNITSGDNAAIKASETRILRWSDGSGSLSYDTGVNPGGALKVGPDGRVFIIDTNINKISLVDNSESSFRSGNGGGDGGYNLLVDQIQVPYKPSWGFTQEYVPPISTTPSTYVY